MTKYIDVDVMLERAHDPDLAWEYDLRDLDRFIADVPTADVVPRAEVAREILAELELFCNAAKADIARAQRYGLELGLIGLAVSASGEISGVNRALTFIEILKQKYGVTENG